MNLVDAWFDMYLEKYETRAKCIETLNMICGMKIRESEFSEYKNKKRKPNLCMQWIMRCDIMMAELKKAGWKDVDIELSGQKLIELIDVLSPPKEWEI